MILLLFDDFKVNYYCNKKKKGFIKCNLKI